MKRVEIVQHAAELLAPTAISRLSGWKLCQIERFRLALGPCIMHDMRAADPYMVRRIRFRRSVAQLVEHRSPKPGVAGSSPATPASVTL